MPVEHNGEPPVRGGADGEGQQPVADSSERHGTATPQPVPLSLAQVNLVVADLAASRAFYAHLGFTFADREVPGQGVVAAVATEGPVPLVLHSPGFASWWDPGSPGASAGGVVIDLDVPSTDALDALVTELREAGATIVREPTDMPWGQRFAVFTDPDRHRWSLKAGHSHA